MALGATAIAALIVLEVVGGFGSAVQFPAAIVIKPAGSTAVVPSPSKDVETDAPAATFVKPLLHVIEGGDESEGVSTTTSGGEGDAGSTGSSVATVTASPSTTTSSRSNDGGGSNRHGSHDGGGKHSGTTTTTEPGDNSANPG